MTARPRGRPRQTGAVPVTRPRERPRVREVLDAVAFVLAGLAVAWLAGLVLVDGVGPGWRLVLLLVFWVLVAYLLLPGCTGS